MAASERAGIAWEDGVTDISGRATDRSRRHVEPTGIRLWQVIGALLAVLVAVWAMRDESLLPLRELVSDRTYFKSHPLLIDELRSGYTVETVRAHLAALGNTGRAFYADTQIALYDLLFPITLLAFGLLLILHATNPENPNALAVPRYARRALLLVPVLLFAADMLENMLIVNMIDAYPRVSARVVETASLMTELKWHLGLVDALIVVGLSVFVVYRLIEEAPAQRR